MCFNIMISFNFFRFGRERERTPDPAKSVYRTTFSKLKLALQLLLLAFLVAILIPGNISADTGSGFWNWRAYESDNFVLFFPTGYENQVKLKLPVLISLLPTDKKLL